MYESFFRFRERPFDLSPKPRFFVLTESHREALRNLQYAFASRTGVTLLLGEAGSGKSTVIRAAIASQSGRAHCIHLNNPTLSRQEFNEMIAQNFGLSSQAAISKTAMLAELQALLTERLQRDETSVLVLDEAQSMPVDLLEEVRLLANIETDDTKLLSIVLAGQPELADRLNEHKLRQLKQRVALRCDIRPLSREETEAYLADRIQTAGGERLLFTADAVAVIHRASRGLPRTINVIADNALLGAFAADRAVVDVEIVQRVCKDFDLDAGRVAPSTYFDEIVPVTRILEPLPAPDPVMWSTSRERTISKALGYSLVVALIGIVFAASMGTVGRDEVQPPRRAERALEAPVTWSTGGPAQAPVVLRVASPAPALVAAHVPPPPPTAVRGGDRTAPAASARSAPSVDQPLRAPRAADVSVVNARSRAVPPPVRPPDRVTPPRNLAAPRPPPALSIAATWAAVQPPVDRMLAAAASEPRLGPPPQVTVQAVLPASAAAPPSIVSSAVTPVVSVPTSALPATNVAGPARGSGSAAPAAATDAPIQSVLEQYRHAFGTLTAAGVERFWPNVDTRTLQRAFDQIDSQQIEFDSCVTSTGTGSRAQVSCGGRTTFVPKVGNRTPRVESRRWTFHLSRANAAWVIERVESR